MVATPSFCYGIEAFAFHRSSASAFEVTKDWNAADLSGNAKGLVERRADDWRYCLR